MLIRMHAPPEQRSEILGVVAVFLGRIVDIAASSMIIEITGTTQKIDNFVELMRPYGIEELARSGAVALVRGDQAGNRRAGLGLDGATPEGSRAEAGDTGASVTADTTGDI
jgi:hypothetical protein